MLVILVLLHCYNQLMDIMIFTIIVIFQWIIIAAQNFNVVHSYMNQVVPLPRMYNILLTLIITDPMIVIE